jgi:hypothetical protein
MRTVQTCPLPQPETATKQQSMAFNSAMQLLIALGGNGGI